MDEFLDLRGEWREGERACVYVFKYIDKYVNSLYVNICLRLSVCLCIYLD